MEHALQEKTFKKIKDKYNLTNKDLDKIRKYLKDSYNAGKYIQPEVQSAIKTINKGNIKNFLKNKGLNPAEISHIYDYLECELVNNRRQNYISLHKEEIKKFFKSTKDLSDEDIFKIKQTNKIIDRFYKIDYDYRNCNFEVGSEKAANKLTGDISNALQNEFIGRHQTVSVSGIQSNAGTQYRNPNPTNRNKGKIKETGQKYAGQEISPFENRSNEEQKIKDKALDKVYKWHGDIGADRFDVDKTLNFFVQTTKGIAKEYSCKIGT